MAPHCPLKEEEFVLPTLSLFKREYPKGEGVIKNYNTKVLSKLLHRRAVPLLYVTLEEEFFTAPH